MSFDDIFWYVAAFLFFFGGATLGFLKHLQSQRHQYRLAIQQEKTKQAQAQARALEEKNRQAALKLREAELEIERYDRRIPGTAPTPHLPSGVDHEDIDRIAS
jgi:hypothetical protein